MAIPKVGVRERDEDYLNMLRARGVCEVCKRLIETEACHVKTRGSGGADRGNAISGCRACHTRTELAGQAGKDELLAIIAARPAEGTPEYERYMHPLE